MATISVIVTIYNTEKYLNRCVESILNQTFSDFELILVDDGSQDNCGKICDDYAKRDNRVNVIHKQNGGLSEARNYGIEWALKNSDSEWITFIDSDDWVHPKYHELLLNAAVDKNTDISICNYKTTDGKKEIFNKNSTNAELWSVEDFWIQHNTNAVIACGKLYKKGNFINLRYPVGKLHEDEFTTHKVLFKYEKVAYLNQELYYYFTNPEGITKSKWTPKRLVAIEAVINQFEFFASSNFNKALEYTVQKQLNLFCREMNLIIHSENKSNKKYLVILRKQLKKYVKNYKNEYSITVINYPHVYECLYPKRMWIYWIIKAQINKIRK